MYGIVCLQVRGGSNPINVWNFHFMSKKTKTKIWQYCKIYHKLEIGLSVFYKKADLIMINTSLNWDLWNISWYEVMLHVDVCCEVRSVN